MAACAILMLAACLTFRRFYFSALSLLWWHWRLHKLCSPHPELRPEAVLSYENDASAPAQGDEIALPGVIAQWTINEARHASSYVVQRALRQRVFSRQVAYIDSGDPDVERAAAELTAAFGADNVVTDVFFDKGFLTYNVLLDAMWRFPDVSGYLMVGDDVLFRLSHLQKLPVGAIWYPDAARRAAQLHGWDIDGSDDIGWPHWPHYKPHTLAVLERLPLWCLKSWNTTVGDPHRLIATTSDLLYVPNTPTIRERFLKIGCVASKQDLFLEIALPIIVACASGAPDTSLWTPVKGRFLWGAARADPTSHFRPSDDFIHPIKLSNRTLVRWACGQLNADHAGLSNMWPCNHVTHT